MNRSPTRMPRGTVLFRAGDPCAGFVIVHEGSIRVTLGAANGREVVLYRVAPGDVCLQTFSCLVENRDYSAEGVAETELLAEFIPAQEFRRRIATDEVLARETASGRAAVSRQLAIIADEGLVRLQRGGVIILDRARLQSLAAGR